MKETKLIAKKRDLEGTSNSRRLRKTGALPGVIYGADKEPISVEVDAHDFEQLFHHHASESLLIEIEIEGEGSSRVLVKDVQHHPVSSDILHVDMMRVVAGKVINVEIQLVLVGESEGVKAGGNLDHVMHSISVECLPKDVIESIEVDVTELEIGAALKVADLALGDKYKALVDDQSIIAMIAAPRVEEEEDATDSTGEPEVITEKKEVE